MAIEPHLGPLKRVAAVFPYRDGEIRATYTADGKNVQARIELPPALKGNLVWKGRTYTLHEGTQELVLNP